VNNKKWFVILLINFGLVSGCTEKPQWKVMYDECKDKVQASLSEAKKDKNTQSMGEMAESMGIATCEIIKSTCEGNEEGFTCKAITDNKK